MRSVRSAICTSGDPVSVSLRRYFSTVAAFDGRFSAIVTSPSLTATLQNATPQFQLTRLPTTRPAPSSRAARLCSTPVLWSLLTTSNASTDNSPMSHLWGSPVGNAPSNQTPVPKIVKSFGIYEHVGIISLKILQSFSIFKSMDTILTKILQSFCWSESARAEVPAASFLKSRLPPPQRPRRSRRHPRRRPDQSPPLLPRRVRRSFSGCAMLNFALH